MRRLALTLLLIAAAACGGDKSTAPKRIEGIYALHTLGGTTPPMVIYDDTTNHQRIELLSGKLTIASGTFSNAWSFRVTDNGTVSPYSETCTGTFTRSGNTITLTETDNGSLCGGDAYEATWDGNNTITAGQVVYMR